MFNHWDLTSYSLVTGLPGSTPEIMFPVLYTVLVMVELRLLDNEDLSLFSMSILTKQNPHFLTLAALNLSVVFPASSYSFLN